LCARAAFLHPEDRTTEVLGGSCRGYHPCSRQKITIDPAYVLGTSYDLRITAAESRIEIFYNGRLAAEIPRSGSGWYRAYVQSNPARGGDSDAAAEVVSYSLHVEHAE
jgi:hypothetical protein